jgi:diadenosine tetraphosphate (Ap4A) HIT family hydrolase
MADDFQKFMIREYKHWGVYLHKNQYFLGRVYIWAKREDAVDLMQMTTEEREELFDIGRAVNNALSELFKPDLMNYAALGNISTHLHLHVIPRYSSSRTFAGQKFVDERWGKNYAPYNYDFETPESVLVKIRDSIREKLR